MRIKHIEVFNAIMLTGSVSGAARLLHVSQPAVTQTLQHAQLQLGYPLFTRQRNRLVPTRESLTLLPEVQALMSQLESVRRIASALGRGGIGPLRILVVPSLSVSALPQALTVFKRRYPDLPLSIRSLHSQEIARAIALQEGDVGFVYGSRPHPAVHQEIVATGCLVCVAPISRNDRRSTISLQEMLSAPFIRIDEQDAVGALIADQWSRLGLTPTGGMTVHTHHMALLLAAQGFGLALVDSFTAQGATALGLRQRTLTPEIPLDVRALLPTGVSSPKPAQYFIEAMRKTILSQ